MPIGNFGILLSTYFPNHALSSVAAAQARTGDLEPELIKTDPREVNEV